MAYAKIALLGPAMLVALLLLAVSFVVLTIIPVEGHQAHSQMAEAMDDDVLYS